MSWAVLGHDLDIETFDGMRTISVPEGCQQDDTVALKGLGVARVRQQGERGDLIAHIAVRVPTKLDEHERQLMEEFAASHDADASHVAQSSKPAASGSGRKGFFSKLKDALS